MEFPKTAKKIKYTLIGQITIEAGEDAEIQSILDAMRNFGEAEIVDVEVLEPEDNDD